MPRTTPDTIGSIAARVWNKIMKRGPDKCWPWMGPRTASGAAFVTFIGSNGKSNSTLAPRVVWLDTYGAVPDGMKVFHKCRRYCCCNPNHLYLGRPIGRAGYKPMAERFYSRVNKSGPKPRHKPSLGRCWEWIGAINS